ncbi:unnamed protein product [Vitrella brassicaformis CCMP3155]|uniref:Uncharacterized protein n=1 Tax=Vitrella brassicaformis (strain CCMP3155) TaxID=1169540 RepID=A0A0G4EST2_VITBC|nr:unnamed protein product [Vitrella brassicaformis CCMP3155]|eukprot:CEM00940.1 unnamed protein product [Vitrella brassicaformis CCMP3155]
MTGCWSCRLPAWYSQLHEDGSGHVKVTTKAIVTVPVGVLKAGKSGSAWVGGHNKRRLERRLLDKERQCTIAATETQSTTERGREMDMADRRLTVARLKERVAELERLLEKERQFSERLNAENAELRATIASMEEERDEEGKRAAFGHSLDAQTILQLDSHCFKYDGLVRHFKNIYDSFPDFYYRLMKGFFPKDCHSATAAPDIMKLLLKSEREFLWAIRPHKYKHFYELLDWLEGKAEELLLNFAANNSALECVSRAIRAARRTDKMHLIAACDIICILIFIIKKYEGQWYVWLWGIIIRIIVSTCGLCAAALINGGGNCPRLVANLPDALALVEKHQNDLNKLSVKCTMPHDAVNLIVDETLATLHGPVLSTTRDEVFKDRQSHGRQGDKEEGLLSCWQFMQPLIEINKTVIRETLGHQYWDRLSSGAARPVVGIPPGPLNVREYNEGKLRAPLAPGRVPHSRMPITELRELRDQYGERAGE